MSYYGFEPANLGLEYVGSLSFRSGWEWDELSILRHLETGEFYWLREAGCSCNGPLEFIDSLDEFDGHGDFFALAQVIDTQREEHRQGYDGYDDHPDSVDAEAVELLARLRGLR